MDPQTLVFLEVCQGSECQTIETSINTFALVTEVVVNPSEEAASPSGGEEADDPQDSEGPASSTDPCPDDFNGWFTTFPLPDLSEVHEVGAPGRILTDEYKGHGYFRLPNGQNAIEVRMPIDASLTDGSVYLQSGDWGTESQYMLTFQTACEGLRFHFDHIEEPVPAIAELVDWEPTFDSRTHHVGPLEMSVGDLVATSIGFLGDGNAFLDFGVQDRFHRLPTPQHPSAYGGHLDAVCIFTFFDSETAAYLRAKVPAASVHEIELCPPD